MTFRLLDIGKVETLKDKNNFYFNLGNFKKPFFFNRLLKVIVLTCSIFIPLFFQKRILSDTEIIKLKPYKDPISYSNIKWEKVNLEKKYEKQHFWEKIEKDENKFFPNKKFITDKETINYEDSPKFSNKYISSFNRSIVFDNSIVGPDISWLVPPGFKWNNRYKFDLTTIGHSGRFEKGRKGKGFWGWNDGDAVGLFYYQFLNNEKTSFGLNYGIRSVYEGSALGGNTAVGEGQSLGFRIDRKISQTEGFSFGAEQLLHFDGLTDSGRNIYLTLSKAFWRNNKEGQFPIDVYTFGVATGRMAEGNIKFLCSDLLGGSGTEVNNQRSLCWAPVFSLSRVFNKKFSTFFEYNSKWFILGSSIIPFNEIPLRGTFAIQLSDHIDNYKLNNFDEMKWVFRLSLGF